MSKIEIPTSAERTVSIGFRADSAEADRFKGVSISSNAAIERFWGREILVHDADAINMERAGADGLPMLVNHDMDRLIGRIRNVRLDGDRLRGDLVFDESDPEALRWRAKMEEGIAKDFSVRYTIDAWERIQNESGADDFIITRWSPLEGSAVSVPADPSVGIGRQIDTQEGETMTQGNENDQAGGRFEQFRDAVAYGKRQGETKGEEQALERVRAIDELFANPRYSDERFQTLRSTLIQSGASLVEAQRQLLNELNAGDPGPVAGAPQSDKREYVHASPGADNMEKWSEGVESALMFRCGLDKSEETKREMGENPFAGLRLLEIGRDYLRQIGVNAGSLVPQRAALMALQRSGIIAHGTSDFTNVLANVAEKSLTLGYTKAPETWRPFCRVTQLSDFKQAKLVNLTSFTALAVVAENAEYTEGTYGEVGENIQLATYGKIFGLSRQAIVNDDVNAFSMVPRGMGAAAARVVGNLVYNTILLGNPTLDQDSTDLFHADHGNYVAAGSGAAPSVTTLDTAIAAMGVQKDPDDRETLNIRPAFLIVPKALEGTARVLTSSMSVQSIAPGVTSGTTVTDADNRFADLTVISEARIDNSDAAKWFLSADPNEGVIDTINVAFLDGMEEPYMEQENGFSSDGVRWKVRLDAAAEPVAYQGLYHNDGD